MCCGVYLLMHLLVYCLVYCLVMFVSEFVGVFISVFVGVFFLHTKEKIGVWGFRAQATTKRKIF